MKLKKYSEYKDLDGYIGISSLAKKDYQNNIFIESDIIFNELSYVSRPLYLDDDKVPCYQLIHKGGAFLSSEKFQNDVIVNKLAHIIITSQSASKVHLTKNDDEPTSFNLNVKINNRGILEYINDSLILFPRAKFYQYNTFNVHKTGWLIYSDIVSIGYNEHSQMHEYTEMLLRTKIFYDNKLVLFDNLFFEPQKQDPNQFYILNNFERHGSMFLINENLNQQTVDQICELTSKDKFNFDYDLGISLFSNGCIGIRMLANQTYEIEYVFSIIHNFIRKCYLNKNELNLRKQP